MNQPADLHLVPAWIDSTARAMAAVLRDRRETAGWSRRQVAEQILPKIGVEISDRTLLAYEKLGKDDQGRPAAARAITMRRVLELGAAYQVPASTMVREAELRAGLAPRCTQCGHDIL